MNREDAIRALNEAPTPEERQRGKAWLFPWLYRATRARSAVTNLDWPVTEFNLTRRIFVQVTKDNVMVHGRIARLTFTTHWHRKPPRPDRRPW